MGKTERIALVDTHCIDEVLLNDLLKTQISGIDRFTDASRALDALKQAEYRAILLSLSIDSGTMPEFAGTHDHSTYDLGVPTRLIRQLRAYGSANKDTPIIVADHVHEKKDPHAPNASSHVIAAGANRYVNLIESAYPGLAKIIQYHLAPRALASRNL